LELLGSGFDGRAGGAQQLEGLTDLVGSHQSQFLGKVAQFPAVLQIHGGRSHFPGTEPRATSRCLGDATILAHKSSQGRPCHWVWAKWGLPDGERHPAGLLPWGKGVSAGLAAKKMAKLNPLRPCAGGPIQRIGLPRAGNLWFHRENRMDADQVKTG